MPPVAAQTARCRRRRRAVHPHNHHIQAREYSRHRVQCKLLRRHLGPPPNKIANKLNETACQKVDAGSADLCRVTRLRTCMRDAAPEEPTRPVPPSTRTCLRRRAPLLPLLLGKAVLSALAGCCAPSAAALRATRRRSPACRRLLLLRGPLNGAALQRCWCCILHDCRDRGAARFTASASMLRGLICCRSSACMTPDDMLPTLSPAVHGEKGCSCMSLLLMLVWATPRGRRPRAAIRAAGGGGSWSMCVSR